MKRLQTISHILCSTKSRIRKNRDTAGVLFVVHARTRREWGLVDGRWGMQSSLSNLRSSTSVLCSPLILVVISLLFTLSSLLAITYTRPAHVQAAANNTINFQARILTASGAVVPDGTYNVEFKLYDSAGSGTSAQGVCSLNSSTDDCWWVETRTGANRVTTKNGYVTAALGDTAAGGTAFGANVPWDQELWLSMRIGGTGGSPSWDAEMSPRMKVTAVPYAMTAQSAQQLKVTNGSNSTTLSVTNPTGVNTILVPDASGTVAVSASGNIALSAAGNVTLTGQIPIANGGTGASSSQGAINVLSQLTTEGDLLYFNGTNSTRFARGANGECLKSNATTIIWGTCGAASGTLQSAYDAGGAGDQVIALTTTNDSLIFRNPSSGGTNGTGYVLTIDQLATGAIGGMDIQSAGTGNLLRIRDTTATAADVLVVADGGAVTLQNQTNSTSALRVLTQSGTNFFNIDSTNQQLTLRNKTDDATIGAELFTGSYSFPATAGWSAISGTGSSAIATHNSGNTNTLYASPSFTPVAGATYQITFDTTGNPPLGEYVVVAIGTLQGPEVYGNQTGATQVLTATTTDQLQFTPTDGWTGTISNISIKRITRTNPVLQVLDSTGASQLELRVGGATGNRSLFIGQYAGQANTSSGYFNTGLGEWNLTSNTTGSYNTAVGGSALTYNTIGSSNVAFGESALYSNTSGSNNTGFGTSSLFSNTTGSNNVAVGSYSLSSVTVGSNNTALGTSAGEYDNNQSQFASLNNLQGSTMLGAYSQAFANNVLALGGQGTNSVKVGIGTGLPTNQLSAEAYRYSTGTVDTNGTTTVTGSGTTFTSDMVGNVIYIASGNNTTAPYVRTITGYTSATSITVNSSVPTLSGAEYYINYVGLQVKTDGDTQLGGNLLANGIATNITGTTEATARTNVTNITLTTDAFNVNDVIFFDNAGQDYYTRITVDNADGTYTVSPAVSYDVSATVTKYTAQNIGATTTDYTTQSNRFFQGYFLGGVVTGAGSTTLSDGNLVSSNALRLQSASGLAVINTSNSTTAFQVQNTNGVRVLNADTTNGTVEVGSYNGGTNAVAGKLVVANTTNANTVTIESAAVTANRTITLPDASGTLCLSSGNCAGDGGSFYKGTWASGSYNQDEYVNYGNALIYATTATSDDPEIPQTLGNFNATDWGVWGNNGANLTSTTEAQVMWNYDGYGGVYSKQFFDDWDGWEWSGDVYRNATNWGTFWVGILDKDQALPTANPPAGFSGFRFVDHDVAAYANGTQIGVTNTDAFNITSYRNGRFRIDVDGLNARYRAYDNTNTLILDVTGAQPSIPSGLVRTIHFAEQFGFYQYSSVRNVTVKSYSDSVIGGDWKTIANLIPAGGATNQVLTKSSGADYNYDWKTFNVQAAYDSNLNGNTAELKVDSTRGGLDIQDANTTINGNLLTVRASNGSGLGNAMFNVNSTGQALFKNSTNSKDAFSVQNSNGANLLNIDTTNNTVVVGPVPPASLTPVIVDDYMTATPTGTLIANATYVPGSYLSLTEGGYQFGRIEYTPSISTDFDARFQFYTTGNGNSNFMYAYNTSTPLVPTDATGGYIVAYYDEASSIRLYFNGTLLASASATGMNDGQWHGAKIIKSGTNIRVYYDNVLKINYDDISRTLTGTKLGLGGWTSAGYNGVHRVKNFKLFDGAIFNNAFSVNNIGAGNSLSVFASDTNVLNVTSTGGFVSRNTTNSATAFQIQNASGANLFTVDTTNGRLQVGSSTTDATANLFVLDSYNNGTDPTGVNGAQYYNTSLNKFRCYQNSAWTDCIGAGGGGSASTLQDAYNYGSAGDQVIQLTSVNDSLIFRNPSSSGTDSTFTVKIEQLNTGIATDSLVVSNFGTGDILSLQDSGVNVLSVTDGGHIKANRSSAATTGTTEATARANVTSITLTSDAFDVNDVIFFDNAGQDYYTRIVVDNADGTYAVSPAVSYDASITVTKYNIQNIGATDTDYTTQSNRFFQGYFLGGVVTGAGSTTLSDGNLTSSTGLTLQTATGTTLQSTSNSADALRILDSNGIAVLKYDTANRALKIGGTTGVVPVGELTNWVERTAAVANNWNSVTYGNGLFVAVATSGTGNRVMTSPDGITWTSRTSPADLRWASVTYGNGLFVAVSDSGEINSVMTSPDGITWTLRTAASDNYWYSVTYGNGLFVAVAYGGIGTGDRVMTSPDGITWTSRVSAADYYWESVTYGNGMFVAVADEGVTDSVMTSPNGIDWTLRTAASDHWWNSVTYGNGKFVAVAYDGSGTDVMTSPDGITWTAQTTPANGWASVTYGNGLFVAVSWDETGMDAMASPDGINWVDYATPNTGSYWNSVTYGNGQFVAVATGSGLGNRVMTGEKPEASLYVQGDQINTGNVTISGQKTTIKATGAQAFSVQNASAGDIFNIDTVNNILTLGYDIRGKMFEKQEATYGVGLSANSVVSADFNGDGNSDLATSNLAEETVSVLLGNGDGTFDAAVNYGTATTPSNIATGDYDKDGDIDLAVTNESSASVSILMNNGDGTFATKVDYAVNNGPAEIASADFDKDGDMDLVVVNSSSSNASILMNNGDGTFATKVDYATLTYPQALTVYDFDGDGDIDVAVTYASSSNFSVLSNNGNGTFATKVDTIANRNVIASSDFNNDGLGDVVVASSTTSVTSIAVYIKNGTGYNTKYYTVGTQPSSITPVDVNKDGKNDILVTNRSSGSVSVLLNNGDGTFAEKDDYGVSASSYDMAAADFDKDGDMDMAVLDDSSAVITILKNKSLNISAVEAPAVSIKVSGSSDSLQINTSDGRSNLRVDAKGNTTIGGAAASGSFGLFSKGATVQLDVDATDMAVADINADGGLDIIVVGGYSADTATVYLRQIDGSLSKQSQYTTGDTPQKVITADFNKDNKIDFAVSNSNSNTVMIYFGDGNGNFSAGISYATGGGPVGIIATDLNKDGSIDIATANSDDSTISVLLNSGSGTFATNVDYAAAEYGYPYQDIAYADFDRDGDNDIVVANSDLDSVSVFKNNGNGAFAASTEYYVGSYPWGMTVYDYDRNGSIDILVGSDDYMSVLLNDGTGTFGTKQDIDCNYNCEVSAAADINNDGYDDVVMGGIYYMLNNRSGGLDAIVEYEEYDGAYKIAVVDVDGDGDKDILNLTSYDRIETALNNTISNSRFKVVDTANTKALLDINQNGSMTVQVTSDVAKAFTVMNSAGSDVLNVNAETGSLSVGVNGSITKYYSGTFTSNLNYNDMYNPTSADFNHDGLTDIAYELSGNLKIMLSNGNGNFTQASQTSLGGSAVDMKAGDVDGDGYDDVVSVGSNNVMVSINNGDGTFAAKVDYAKVSDSYNVSLALSDLDKDGDLDVAVNNPNANTVSIFLNNGDGTFAAKVDYALGMKPEGIVSADIDKDGDIDLVLLGGNNIKTFFNDGAGAFSGGSTYAVGLYTWDINTSDYDRDGDIDVLVSSTAGSVNEISVFANNGNGTYASVKYTSALTDEKLTMFDANNDGYEDFVTTFGNVYANNKKGDYYLLESTGVGSGYTYYTAPVVLDLNGDKKLDLLGNSAEYALNQQLGVLAAAASPSLAVNTDGFHDSFQIKGANDQVNLKVSATGNTIIGGTTGLGASMFSKMSEYGTGGFGAWQIAKADFNKDGNQDVVTSDNAIFYGNGKGGLTGPSAIGTNDGEDLLTADVDNDGDIDVITSYKSCGICSGYVGVIKNNNNGTFAARVSYNVGPGDYFLKRQIMSVDYNKDGYKDIIFSDETITKIMINDGTGAYSTINDVAITDVSAAADYDKDGDIDLVAFPQNPDSPYDTTLKYYENDGGTFTETQSHGFVGEYASSYDINGDGYEDILTGGGELAVLYNNSGTIEAPIRLLTTDITASWDKHPIEFVDIDNDGDIDFVGGGAVAINNAGKYTLQAITIPGNPEVRSTLTADVDRDGDLDIIYADEPNAKIIVLKNNGLDNTRFGVFSNTGDRKLLNLDQDGSFTIQSATNSTNAFNVQNVSGNSLLAADTTNMRLTVSGDIIAHGTATTTTGITEAASQTNVTEITLTADAFNVNDVVYFNNAGQDYYTRIVVDNADGTYTVSPAVSYDGSITVTKYIAQSIGAVSDDYTTQEGRFFQGYFLGGIVAGAGSTIYSDGNIKSTNGMTINTVEGVVIKSSDEYSNILQLQMYDGTPIFTADGYGITMSVQSVNINGTLSIAGHLLAYDGAGAIGVNTGTVCSGTTVSVNGTDVAGNIEIDTGTGCAAGKIAELDFGSPYEWQSEVQITLTPANAAAADLKYFISSSYDEGFEVHTTNVPANSTYYKFYYHVIAGTQPINPN